MDQRELNRIASMNRDAAKLVGPDKTQELFEAMDEINQKAIEEVRTVTIRRPRPSQPGRLRNKPCPCGSGIKFKKCCMNKEI